MLLYGKLSSVVVLSKATAAETPYRIRACSSPGDDDEDVDLDDDDDEDDDKEGLLTSTGALHAAADRQRLAPAPRLGGRDDWEMEELGQNSSVGAAAQRGRIGQNRFLKHTPESGLGNLTRRELWLGTSQWEGSKTKFPSQEGNRNWTKHKESGYFPS